MNIPDGKRITMAIDDNRLHTATKPPLGVQTIADCGVPTPVYICADWERNPIKPERACTGCFR